MMILKTNRLNLILTFLVGASAHAGAPQGSPFTCLRELMTVTDRGSFQRQRKDVETPFIREDRYIIFPEVVKKNVTGFFVYDEKNAYYYDTAVMGVESKKETPIAQLKAKKIFQMTVQPSGLDTLTIFYQPGFESEVATKDGPVMLGSSVLPIIGAVVSRPESYDYSYRVPEVSGGRGPASASVVPTQMVSLKTKSPKSVERLWQPLNDELRLRKNWVKSNNLDEATFKNLSRIMDTTCRE